MKWVKQHPATELGSALDVLRAKHRLYETRRLLDWEAT